MKKTIIIAMLMLLPGIACAQSEKSSCYRAFIDWYFGIPTGKGETFTAAGADREIRDLRDSFAFGMNVTGGYQFTPNLFAGVGVGAFVPITQFDNYNLHYEDRWDETILRGIYLPMYADIRWTWNIEKVFTPFVDVKVGYQAFYDTNDDIYVGWNDSHNYDLLEKGKKGVYFQPSVGLRLGGKTGFNLGLAYNMSVKKSVTLRDYDSNQGTDTYTHLKDKTTGTLLLSLGIDF